MRVFALSDLHVDYSENMAWIRGLSASDYRADTLLVAGDVCHQLDHLEAAVTSLLDKFRHVFFVTGNHDLWLVDQAETDSRARFETILNRCRAWGLKTEPARVDDGMGGVWVVPLFGWYAKPEEGADSLFLPKPGENSSTALEGWADDRFVRWDQSAAAGRMVDSLLQTNAPHLDRTYDGPVLTFSHFLPRRELMFPPQYAVTRPSIWPPTAGFNFSRVAGTNLLDAQVRKLQARVHVYGHQHRNRWCWIDGVLYVSHCLGYPHERRSGRIGFFHNAPRLIWENGAPAAEGHAP
jgi:predicted phosphodiesterase